MPSHATLQRDLQAALIELDAKIEPYSRPLVPKDPNAPPVTVVATSALHHRPWPGHGPREAPRFEAQPRRGVPIDEPAVDQREPRTSGRRLRGRAAIANGHPDDPSSLDTYRGARWAELGRARWQLMLTTTVAGIVAFLVLALALIRGVHPDQLMAGWAYFLVGAAAGLFLRLRLASEESQVTDDYGLEAARVFQTPLLSGMAAIIGVVLMASLAGSSLGDILTPAEPTRDSRGGGPPRPEGTRRPSRDRRRRTGGFTRGDGNRRTRRPQPRPPSRRPRPCRMRSASRPTRWVW